jgi:hypothetical protein
MDNLEKFVRDFLDDKVDPYLKSEAVPDDNDGPVKVSKENITDKCMSFVNQYLMK